MLLQGALGGVGHDDRLLEEFERVLREADQDILDWVFGRSPWPAHYHHVMSLLRREKTLPASQS